MGLFSSKFRLNRLRRSFSSWPNPLIGFQHFACIWACKICSSSATTHSPCFIVEFRHFQLVPHFVPKLCLQRSYFQSFTFHTAYLWTTSVSISAVFSAALFFFLPTGVFLTCSPSVVCAPKPACRGRVPGRPDTLAPLGVVDSVTPFEDLRDASTFFKLLQASLQDVFAQQH